MSFQSPVYNVIKVPIEKVQANDYNPNSVATKEMKLLYKSIKEDGYTMPIVCFFDKKAEKYVIVDGFHRYSVMLKHNDIYEREGGCLPVSVIDKDINQRRAATVRHNRARGKHGVELQAALVALMKSDMKEEEIIDALGMTLEEIQRLLGVRGIVSEIHGVPYSIEKQIIEVGGDVAEDID